MKHIYIFPIFLFIFQFSAKAWNENPSTGARSSALGNASVCLSDVWSTQNNQAGLGYLKQSSVGIYYDNKFLVKGLGTKAAAFAMPLKGGVIGANVTMNGNNLYNESKYGLGFAKAFNDRFSFGLQMDYLMTSIAENYGNKGVLAAELGVHGKVIKGLSVGFHIFNPTRAKLATYTDERIPTMMKLGLNYNFSEKVFLAIETEKDIDFKSVFKVGIEYQVIKQLYLRGGVSTDPTLSSFGFGVHIDRFYLDISSTIHSVLGYSPQIGMRFDLNKKTK